MAKPKADKRMKGVSTIERDGKVYWYAFTGSKRVYCGEGKEGKELAEARRSEYVQNQYKARQSKAGMVIEEYEINSFRQLHNWYFESPDIQESKDYPRKLAFLTHLSAYFKDRALSRFERDEQARFRAHRRKEGASHAEIDKEIRFLGQMFREAMRCKKIHPSVMPGKFYRKKEFNPRRIVTDEEFDKLVEKANPFFRDVLVCGYESAMRAGEIMNLRASQVHLEVQHISGVVLDYIDLGIFDTKTATRRMVPVSARLKEVLERRLQGLGPEDLVFSNSRGKRYTASKALSALMRSTCEQAGVLYGDKTFNDRGERVGVVFHSLRHTRVTKWVEMGFSDELIRRASGHKSLEAYRNYVKISDARPLMRLVQDEKTIPTKPQVLKSIIQTDF